MFTVHCVASETLNQYFISDMVTLLGAGTGDFVGLLREVSCDLVVVTLKPKS